MDSFDIIMGAIAEFNAVEDIPEEVTECDYCVCALRNAGYLADEEVLKSLYWQIKNAIEQAFDHANDIDELDW